MRVTTRLRRSAFVLLARRRHRAAAAQQAPPPRSSRRRRFSTGLPADGSRWLTFGGNYTNQRHSPLTQITPGQRQPARAAVDVPDRHARQLRDDAARCATTCCTSPARRTWRGRSTRAPAARSGATAASCRPDLTACCGLVNRGFGDARRQAVHDDARRAPARARHEDRRRRLGRDAGGLQDRLRLDDRAARRQGQGHRRRRRRRVRHPRLHRRLRRADRQARLALLHDSRPRRAGQRHLGRRFVEDRRRERLGHRRVRSRAEPAVLRHRQSRARTITARAARATTSTATRSSRSTPTPASCAGTTSSRRTTCTTGTRPRCRSSPTSRSPDSRARS